MDPIQAFVKNHNIAGHAAYWVIRVLVALLIFIVGYVAARLVTRGAQRAMNRRLDATLTEFLSNILLAVMLAVVVITALGQLGIKTTSLLTVLGAAGLAVGLAVKDSLANFSAGVMLILFRPFKAGDYCAVAGTEGVIESIRIFHTMLRTLDGCELWIPNGHIMGGQITNYSRKPSRRVDARVTVSHEADLRKVRKIFESILAADERIHEEPAPQILVVGLLEEGVQFSLRPWTATGDWWFTTCDLLEKIKNTFDEQGIRIAVPRQDVNLPQRGESEHEEAAV